MCSRANRYTALSRGGGVVSAALRHRKWIYLGCLPSNSGYLDTESTRGLRRPSASSMKRAMRMGLFRSRENVSARTRRSGRSGTLLEIGTRGEIRKVGVSLPLRLDANARTSRLRLIRVRRQVHSLRPEGARNVCVCVCLWWSEENISGVHRERSFRFKRGEPNVTRTSPPVSFPDFSHISCNSCPAQELESFEGKGGVVGDIFCNSGYKSHYGDSRSGVFKRANNIAPLL